MAFESTISYQKIRVGTRLPRDALRVGNEETSRNEERHSLRERIPAKSCGFRRRGSGAIARRAYEVAVRGDLQRLRVGDKAAGREGTRIDVGERASAGGGRARSIECQIMRNFAHCARGAARTRDAGTRRSP